MTAHRQSAFLVASFAIAHAACVLVACGDDESKAGPQSDAATDAATDAASSAQDAGRDAARPSDAASEDAAADAAIDAGHDAGPAPSPADIPERLEDTGLYADELGGALASGVREYEPRFAQWADGASKRRYVLLPDGEVIDSSNMDDWVFPVGTKAWEELSRGGSVTETRYIYRYGPEEEHWTMVSYRWQGGQATALPDGVPMDAGADDYVPPSRECRDCHEGRGSRLLGLGAIQLSHDRGDVNLASLEAAGLLSDAPAGDFELPGTTDQQAALGYLHANCGCCHNPTGDPFIKEGVTMEQWQTVDLLATLEGSNSYATALDAESETMPGETILAPGDPDGSLLVELMGVRGDDQMPPVGSTLVDTDGLDLVRGFVAGLASAGDDAGAP